MSRCLHSARNPTTAARVGLRAEAMPQAPMLARADANPTYILPGEADDARGIQEIRTARKRRRSCGRGDHWRCVRRHRQLDGFRYSHARDWRHYRGARLLQSFHSAILEGYRGFDSRGEKAGRCSRLGKLRHCRNQFHHHRLGAVHGDQAHEPIDALRGGKGCSAEQAGSAADRDPRPIEIELAGASLMAAKPDSPSRIVAQNRRARFNYEIGETFEAGISLTGTEVKSLRQGKATIAESYADARGGEIWLVNATIPEYLQGGRFNHAPKRLRKLLLHRRQINKLIGAVEREGMTLVPLKLYFN